MTERLHQIDDALTEVRQRMRPRVEKSKRQINEAIKRRRKKGPLIRIPKNL